MSERPPASEDLIFSNGFLWERGFVKRAEYRGRIVHFRVSTQLVTNCLMPSGSAADPISVFTANDAAVQAACRNALKRVANQPLGTLELQRTDFV